MRFAQMVRPLFLVTIVILIVFGIGSLLRINDNPARAGLYIFYGAIMFGDAAVMAFCVSQLRNRKQWAFYLTEFVLCMNIFPTIIDQFGPVDLLFLLLNLVTLIALVISRKEFLPA